MAAGFGHEGDRLSAFLDDELSERDALAVTRHLRGCSSCRSELEQLRGTRQALRSLPAAAPTLSWMVETAVLVPGEEPSRTRPWLPYAATGVTSIAALLVAAFVLGGSEPGPVRPAVDQLVVDHVRAVEGGPVVTPVRLEGAAPEGSARARSGDSARARSGDG